MPSRLHWWTRFLRHWIRFALRDATLSAFGWATITASAVLVGFFGWDESTDHQWYGLILYALAGVAIGWLIGFVVSLVALAPFKAYRALKPFSLSIEDVLFRPNFATNPRVHGQNVVLVVKNRSSDHLIDCRVQIDGIEGTDPKFYPRFLEKFDLPPGKKKPIPIAYWSSRDAPLADDNTIGICGQVSTGYGGNILRIPIAHHYASIRVQASDDRSERVQGHIWVDVQVRNLRGELFKCPPKPGLG